MKAMVWAGALVAATLGGCQKKDEAAAEAGPWSALAPRGRYIGVGLYTPQQMWAQLARPAAPQDPAAATLEDDEQIIVVIDSRTGELRQCGNLSGHCIALNPWSKTASAQGAPAALLKHARQLAEEADARAKAEAAAFEAKTRR